jgi:uncharacterized glyoxalase superfamily protein PhnB
MPRRASRDRLAKMFKISLDACSEGGYLSLLVSIGLDGTGGGTSMSKPKDGRPASMPWLSPYLIVGDAAKALDFYQRAFGFEKRYAVAAEDGCIKHAEMTYRDAVIMFAPECPEDPRKSPAASKVGSPLSLYVYCDDVDALYARAVAAGARGAMAPQDAHWGDRFCQLVDPDGHVWCFATHLGTSTSWPASA